MNSRLDAIQIGQDLPRGQGLMGVLVGTAIQRIGRHECWGIVPHLDIAEAKQATRRLQALISRHVPYSDVVQEEKWTGQALMIESFKTMDWRQTIEGLKSGGQSRRDSLQIVRVMSYSKSGIMANYTRYMDRYICAARLPYAMRASAPSQPRDPYQDMSNPSRYDIIGGAWFLDARTRAEKLLLLFTLALRAHHLEHGHYPSTLAELAPSYLKKIPDDPFALKGPLRYKRTGDKYVLYSLGPDCKDDGGKPIAESPVHEKSKGDIVAGVNRR
jgi:hypothetical protein